MLAAQRQNEPNRGKLNKDRSENEEDARVLRERFWMIDPQRGNRGRKKQKRDNETLRGFRLRAGTAGQTANLPVCGRCWRIGSTQSKIVRNQ